MAKKTKYTKRPQEEESLILPKVLMDYLDRIDATLLNFRRAMVKEFGKGNKYYIEKAIIDIGENGEIECKRKEFLPTDDEEEAIVEAFKKIKFPTSTNGTIQSAQQHIRDMEGDPDRFFILPDRKSGDVRMMQERIEVQGRKAYIPWSFWNDGRWRKMEPDEKLPFWKPLERVEGKTRIMVHEGCKSARFVHELTTDPSRRKELEKHPWGEQLVEYEHWGMIGGALAPHRTDYDELRREKAHRVIYVCDNDYEGKSALPEVSKFYGQALVGIKFDNSFPPSWDMADSIPKKMFKDGRYNGRPLTAMMHPATFATELVPQANKGGKPTTTMRRTFKEEWVHCVRPEVFVHTDWPSRVWTPKEFNNTVRPYSHIDDTARLLLQDDSNKTAILKYDPSRPSGIYASSGGNFVNTHVPTLIKAEKGNVKPFLEFMELLVPIEMDRTELLRWCATLIARPDIKMHYGVLLISETQGVGKGTLGAEILAPLMGEENVSFPTEDDICKNQFNYWCTHKRLAVVHEIYAGHSATAYNKLKSIITDHNITAQRKYMTPYDLENWLHVFACSNSRRAIQLSSDDRRWFVPKITEDKQPGSYWKSFHDWISSEGGLNKIKQWAHDWLTENKPVERGDAAPWSIAKGEVVEEGYSAGMTLVAHTLDNLNEELTKPEDERTVIANGSKFRTNKIEDDCMILDTDLIELIKKHIHDGKQSDKLERPLTVRKVAKQKGWIPNDSRISSCVEWNLKATGAKLVCKKSDTARSQINVLAKNGRRPFDILGYVGGKM